MRNLRRKRHSHSVAKLLRLKFHVTVERKSC